jgi:cytoskeletal protein CcmA (bactofilin family)
MAKKFLTPIDLNKLELQNAAIQNLATAPSTPSTGQVYYDTVDSKIKVWTGAAWANIGSSQEEIEDYIDGLLESGSGIGLSYNDGANTLQIINTGVTGLTGTASEVAVSASAGNVTLSLPDTINANTSGNAATATALQTARTITIAGGASGSASFNGTSDITLNLAIDSQSAVSSLTGTANEIDVSASVGAITLSLPATINANTTGTAAALTTARTIALTGDVTGTVSFDGSASASMETTIAANSVALGTDTTGDYVASISGTANEIEVTGTGEGATVTIGLPDNVSVTGNLTVGGDLTISGSATYVNTEIIQLADNTIILNSNVTGSPTENSGIEVERGTSTNVSILWNETNDQWTLTNDGTNYGAISRKVAASVGNSSATSFAVVHNLGTRDVTVNVYDNATYDTVETDVVRTDANTVTVSFAVAPSSNAYRVVVVG